jgi:hypothetical protein
LTKDTGKYSVVSIIRNPEHVADIEAAGAIPLQISLEDDPISEFVKAFKGVDIVVSHGMGLDIDHANVNVNHLCSTSPLAQVDKVVRSARKKLITKER